MILCIETSTTKCSAALGRGKEILASREAESPGGGHAAALAPMVDELLEVLRSHEGASLSAIAVSAGPGSYTGLRIGASLAKGLCLGYRVPLIAIDTLELLAHQAQCALPEGRTATLFPLLDARRMEVYAAEFTHTGQRKQDDFAAILDPEALSSVLLQTLYSSAMVRRRPVVCGLNTAMKYGTKALPPQRRL